MYYNNNGCYVIFELRAKIPCPIYLNSIQRATYSHIGLLLTS